MQEIETKKTSVPWTGFDVFVFIAIGFGPLFASVAVKCITSLTQPQEQAMVEETHNHGHPVAQLIVQSEYSLIIFLVVFLSAVVAAPLLEEFVFRMLFQGWLEAKFKRCNIPHSSGFAIMIVSGFFAAMHMGDHSAIDEHVLLIALVLSILYSLLVVSAGILYLAWVKNVRIADYLFGTERFFQPRFFANTGLCLLSVLFCFALTAALTSIYSDVNISPIPIFFFSLVLGILYSRSQNLSYCILLHACLNGTSLMLLWFWFTNG